MTPAEICEALGLYKLKGRKWQGLADNARHVTHHSSNPCSLSQMTSYDAASECLANIARHPHPPHLKPSFIE